LKGPPAVGGLPGEDACCVPDEALQEEGCLTNLHLHDEGAPLRVPAADVDDADPAVCEEVMEFVGQEHDRVDGMREGQEAVEQVPQGVGMVLEDDLEDVVAHGVVGLHHGAKLARRRRGDQGGKTQCEGIFRGMEP
jgi:hypothetical protein